MQRIAVAQNWNSPTRAALAAGPGFATVATTAATSYSCGKNRALKHFFAAHLTMSAMGHKQT